MVGVSLVGGQEEGWKDGLGAGRSIFEPYQHLIVCTFFAWKGQTINKTGHTCMIILIRAQEDFISARREGMVRWRTSRGMKSWTIALKLLIQLRIAFLV